MQLSRCQYVVGTRYLQVRSRRVHFSILLSLMRSRVRLEALISDMDQCPRGSVWGRCEPREFPHAALPRCCPQYTYSRKKLSSMHRFLSLVLVAFLSISSIPFASHWLIPFLPDRGVAAIHGGCDTGRHTHHTIHSS